MNVTDERSPESPPQIEAFEFDPPAIAEGEESKGIIKLSGPAPPDTSITLEGAPAIAEFPAVLLVPSLQTQVTFTALATGSLKDFQEMTFTAKYFSSTKEAHLRIGGVVWPWPFLFSSFTGVRGGEILRRSCVLGSLGS